MNDTLKLKHLAITCGGTGGHFNPGLSIAQELNANGGEAILLLGGKHAQKQKATAEACGVQAYCIPASPISLKNPLKMIRFCMDAIRGMRACLKIFRKHNIQALLSMGSYTSIPPFLARKAAGLPFFLHDGNARLGKANLRMSASARAFAFSFPSVNAEQVKCPAVLTGFPLRAQLLHTRRTREQAFTEIAAKLGMTFDPAKPLLLVTGGSLGAKQINRCVAPDPSDPGSAELQVVHLCGPGHLEETKACYKDLPNPALVLESFEDMGLLYSAADFVISRAGGSTVSELAFFGKYALLVPYPFAAEHHQDDNAAWLASLGGAEIVSDADCTPKFVSAMLKRWVKNRENLIAAGERNTQLAMPSAAINVLNMIAEKI